MFILNLYKDTGADSVACNIVINGRDIAWVKAPGSSEYGSEGSGSTVVHLDPGDKVDVGDCHNSGDISYLTSFNGFLLQADPVFSG